jgi:hypothetical protein
MIDSSDPEQYALIARSRQFNLIQESDIRWRWLGDPHPIPFKPSWASPGLAQVKVKPTSGLWPEQGQGQTGSGSAPRDCNSQQQTSARYPRISRLQTG